MKINISLFVAISITLFFGWINLDLAGVDAQHYVQMLYTYRYNEPMNAAAPFVYRPIIPYLASYLFWLPGVQAMNALSVAMLCVALAFINQIINHYSSNLMANGIALVSAAASYQAVFFGFAAYVDAGAVLFFALAYWLALTKRYNTAMWVVIIGLFIKEYLFLMIPVIRILCYCQRGDYDWVFLAIASPFVYIIGRYYLSDDIYFWYISPQLAKDNILNSVVFAELLLGLGPVALLAIIFGKFKSHHLPLLIGLLSLCILYGYAIISAMPDARIMWPSIIFTSPLVAIWLSGIRQSKQLPLSHRS